MNSHKLAGTTTGRAVWPGPAPLKGARDGGFAHTPGRLLGTLALLKRAEPLIPSPHACQSLEIMKLKSHFFSCFKHLTSLNGLL